MTYLAIKSVYSEGFLLIAWSQILIASSSLVTFLVFRDIDTASI